jgi:hypothetical protein
MKWKKKHKIILNDAEKALEEKQKHFCDKKKHSENYA